MIGAWAIAIVWSSSSVLMLGGWMYQRRTRNAGIVDVLWSAGMAASALFHASIGSGASLPRVLVAVLGGLWGLRLALHVWHRVRTESEDGRYAYLREYWHDDQRKFLAFFLGQGLLTALFSLPFWIAARNPVAEWTIWSTFALAVWIIAIVGEAIADRQLTAHRSDPDQHGRTCRSGLWRYSRHPNYFFEWLHWFTYVFLAIGAGPGWTIASLLGPALMLGSLRWITGIPYTEAQALRTRGDDYREYQRTTSALIPWFPQRSASP
jgi:steroid 5-alpha reductase family enzyme